MVKTKIICTLGPASNCEKIIKQMVNNSMDCARINMSHGTEKENLPLVNLVKKIRKDLNAPVSIMIDTKGPEIRIGSFKNGSVVLKNGQSFTIFKKIVLGDEKGTSCSYPNLFKDVKVGTKIFLNDGLILLKVAKIDNGDIHTKVIHGGKLSDRKSMFLPKVKLGLPFLSVQDKKDLKFAVKVDCDYVAASFVSTALNVQEMRKFLDSIGGKDIKIISKIESALGVKNLDDIIKLSDGIMVARGDLGVELPVEKLPSLQKEIILKTLSQGKIAITATEMLESMIEKSRPTRAEVSDVANAVYDKTSAIMLSGETAVGKNPALVVKTMAKIAKEAEKNKLFLDDVNNVGEISDSIAHSTFATAKEVDAKCIVVFTFSGKTANQIARFRPNQKIVALTVKEKVFNQLALCWNVVPIMNDKLKTIDEVFKTAKSVVKKLKIAKKNDNIVITAGLPLGVSGTTNMIKVEKI